MPTPRSRRDISALLRAQISAEVDRDLVSRVAAVARTSSAPASGPRAGTLGNRLRVAGVALAVAASTAGIALAASLFVDAAPAPLPPSERPPASGVDDRAPSHDADRAENGRTGNADATPDSPEDSGRPPRERQVGPDDAAGEPAASMDTRTEGPGDGGPATGSPERDQGFDGDRGVAPQERSDEPGDDAPDEPSDDPEDGTPDGAETDEGAESEDPERDDSAESDDSSATDPDGDLDASETAEPSSD